MGKSVQMVPMHLGSLMPRVATIKVQVPKEVRIFINSEPCLTEIKCRSMNIQAHAICYRVPQKHLLVRRDSYYR